MLAMGSLPLAMGGKETKHAHVADVPSAFAIPVTLRWAGRSGWPGPEWW